MPRRQSPSLPQQTLQENEATFGGGMLMKKMRAGSWRIQVHMWDYAPESME